MPVVFGWVSSSLKLPIRSEGAEIVTLPPDAALFFDTWTPNMHRGRGFLEKTAQLIADDLAKRNRILWTYVAARDADSVQSVEESGFQRRYSIHQRNLLFVKRVKIRSAETPISRLEVPVAS